MRKVIVFGATGNIGAYLTDYLDNNFDKSEYKVIAVGRKTTSFFSNRGIQYVQMDINNIADFESLPREDIYAVVNLVSLLPAYMQEYNPYAYVETNINGALRILEYARENHADRVLYTQTWSVQGGYWGKESVLSPDMPRSLVYTGDHAFYCITKNMVEDTLRYYREEFGIKDFVFRLPNVYMYHPDKYYYVDCEKRPIGYRHIIDRASRGEPIEMWGDPNAYKDILYVKDLCQMVLKALLTERDYGIYNVGTGVKTTLRQQIEGIIDVFSPAGCRSEIIERPEKGSFTSFVMDIGNAETELGYEPKYYYHQYLEDYRTEQELARFDRLWEGDR